MVRPEHADVVPCFGMPHGDLAFFLSAESARELSRLLHAQVGLSALLGPLQRTLDRKLAKTPG